MINLEFRKSDEALVKSFQKESIELIVHRQTHNGKPVRYIETGIQSDSVPLIVFIHGAPGGCDAFNGFLKAPEMQIEFRMISVDRLGYGYSDYGNAEPSIQLHADMVRHVINEYVNDEVFLVGHSYGGPICLNIALDLKEKVKGSVLIAPAVSPQDELMFWFSSLPVNKIVGGLFSSSLKVSAIEKITHASSLKQEIPKWRNTVTPTLHIHGTRDRLVPFANVEFIKTVIPSEVLEIEVLKNAGHLIPWTQRDKLVQSILRFLDSNRL